MKLLLKDDIPFITITVAYKGAEIEVSDILIDTGADFLIPCGIATPFSSIMLA